MHIALAALTLLGMAQETFDPSKHPWLKHKPGAFAEHTMTIEMGGQTYTLEMSSTLKEITDKNYTTAETTDYQGQKSEEEEVESMPKAAGTETIKVGGKSFDCTIWESTSQKGEKGEKKSVTSVEKGGNLPLKISSTGDDEKSSFTATEFGVKHKVGDKELTCVRLEGSVETKGGTMKGYVLFSPDVPGGMVYGELSGKSPQGEATYKMELTKFGAGGK